ncbi:hypothetical protein MHYP_G00071400 [Metynnis hypsauchen]
MGGANSQGKPECMQVPGQFELMVQKEKSYVHTSVPTTVRKRIEFRTLDQLTSRGSPVTPRTKPSSEHHANLQADWQWRAASLQAPLSGSPRRNLKPPSLTPCHPLTIDPSPEGLPAPKLHPRVGKRLKLDINSDTSLV